MSKKELLKIIKAMGPLHKKLKPPGPHDWLASHYEPGQTFLKYIKSNPVIPDARRRIIYIQPVGNFTQTQYGIIELTAEFLGYFFHLPVNIQKGIPLEVIPASARRRHPSWGMNQILSTYILDSILLPALPEDAQAYLAFTASDLWPGPGWNFVFGQASLLERVGVWSIYRNGESDKSDVDFRLCLLRTLKTAAHETGHMFSMMHCIAYECCMCGSNHREESDLRPLALCPECAAKVCWACNADIIKRYENLTAFCKRNSLVPEMESYKTYYQFLKKGG